MRQVIALESAREPMPHEWLLAAKRMNSRLSMARSITGIPALTFEKWSPLWPGDLPCWRLLRDNVSGEATTRFQYVPADVLRRDDKTLDGLVYQEVFRALYSFPVLPEAVRSDPNLWALWMTLDTPRVIPSGLRRWRGVRHIDRAGAPPADRRGTAY
jgi:hypothetical protein